MPPRAGGAGDTMCRVRRWQDAGKTPDRSSAFPPRRSKTGLRAQSGRIRRFRQSQSRTDEAAELRARTLEVVRGTVQADILKEDQGQNTCIFSTDFALKLMGDIQEWLIAHKVRNFYSLLDNAGERTSVSRPTLR